MGRNGREGIEHPELVRRRIEHECVFVVEAPPAGEDLRGLPELGRRRPPAVLDEERVSPSAKLEIGGFHRADAIPSRP